MDGCGCCGRMRRFDDKGGFLVTLLSYTWETERWLIGDNLKLPGHDHIGYLGILRVSLSLVYGYGQ